MSRLRIPASDILINLFFLSPGVLTAGDSTTRPREKAERCGDIYAHNSNAELSRFPVTIHKRPSGPC